MRGTCEIWISWYENGLKESMLTHNYHKKDGAFIFCLKKKKKSKDTYHYMISNELRCRYEKGN